MKLNSGCSKRSWNCRLELIAGCGSDCPDKARVTVNFHPWARPILTQFQPIFK